MFNKVNESRVIFFIIIAANVMISIFKFETASTAIISFLFLMLTLVLYERYVDNLTNDYKIYIDGRLKAFSDANKELDNKFADQRKAIEELNKIEKIMLDKSKKDLEILHQYYYDLFLTLLGRKQVKKENPTNLN